MDIDQLRRAAESNPDVGLWLKPFIFYAQDFYTSDIEVLLRVPDDALHNGLPENDEASQLNGEVLRNLPAAIQTLQDVGFFIGANRLMNKARQLALQPETHIALLDSYGDDAATTLYATGRLRPSDPPAAWANEASAIHTRVSAQWQRVAAARNLLNTAASNIRTALQPFIDQRNAWADALSVLWRDTEYEPYLFGFTFAVFDWVDSDKRPAQKWLEIAVSRGPESKSKHAGVIGQAKKAFTDMGSDIAAEMTSLIGHEYSRRMRGLSGGDIRESQRIRAWMDFRNQMTKANQLTFLGQNMDATQSEVKREVFLIAADLLLHDGRSNTSPSGVRKARAALRDCISRSFDTEQTVHQISQATEGCWSYLDTKQQATLSEIMKRDTVEHPAVASRPHIQMQLPESGSSYDLRA